MRRIAIVLALTAATLTGSHATTVHSATNMYCDGPVAATATCWLEVDHWTE